MTCERIRTQLTAYLDGELDGDNGTVVRGHLRTCEACRQVATDEAALRDGLRAMPPVDPPSTLWEGVQARLAKAEVEEAQRPAWRRTLARWSRWMPAPRYAMVGGVLAAATIALIIWKTRSVEEPAPIAHDTHDHPSPIIGPEHPKDPVPAPERHSCRQVADAGDVTEDLSRDGDRAAAAYDCAIDELLTSAKQLRGDWTDQMRRDFDDHVAKLRQAIASAAEGKQRGKASRAMVAYLQRAVTRDDVLLAGVP